MKTCILTLLSLFAAIVLPANSLATSEEAPKVRGLASDERKLMMMKKATMKPTAPVCYSAGKAGSMMMKKKVPCTKAPTKAPTLAPTTAAPSPESSGTGTM
jgi:hypothetical protein